MKTTLADRVVDCLKKNPPEQRFSARQIAEWIFENYREECEKKREKSRAKKILLDTDDALIKQIACEIPGCRKAVQKRNSKIKIMEGPPIEFYRTELTEDQEIDQAESQAKSGIASENNLPKNEHELYPILSKYLSSVLGIYSKRIDEKKSRNSHGKGGNEWLFPDIVGIEPLNENWDGEIEALVKQYGDKKSKLWSFEVKASIHRSIVRSYFFQTVSNSAWANFSYLVASEIETNAMTELRMLASLHGVGFIKLNVQDPFESQIIIPAKERVDIDWNAANRLATENKDFNKYIELVRQFYQADRLEKSDWDIPKDED